jgi:hypothetical protein
MNKFNIQKLEYFSMIDYVNNRLGRFNNKNNNIIKIYSIYFPNNVYNIIYDRSIYSNNSNRRFAISLKIYHK